MLIHVLACDYDGTIAEAGVVAPATRAALARVRESGREVVLVTGRTFDDLHAVCPDLDQMFDAVVAENGALLYVPAEGGVKTLGEAPEPALVEALERHGVPLELGASIIATGAGFAEWALAAIRETGVERTLVFNKGSVMLLPGGITKATGLAAALAGMARSPHNTVGVGDAENDHAFLSQCECAAAVADAVPALRERADWVSRGPGPLGVVELVDTHVLADAIDLLPRIPRHRITLGERSDGTPAALPAHLTRLLLVGSPASGTSALTTVLVERLVEASRAVCLIDPAGEHARLAELKAFVVLGGPAGRALPTPDGLAQLLPHPRTSLVLDLSALPRGEMVSYATTALAAVEAVRVATGMPHWLVIDQVQRLVPGDGADPAEWLRPGDGSLCLVASAADRLPPGVRGLVNTLVGTEPAAFDTALRALRGTAPGLPPTNGSDALLADLRGPGLRIERFRVASPGIHRRPLPNPGRRP